MRVTDWFDFVLSVAWLIIREEPFVATCVFAVLIFVIRSVRNEIYLWRNR